jgi:phage terminase small subunit
MSDLTPKQQRFVDEYLIDLNATQAYIRAGYKARGAEANSARLIANDKVRSKIDAAKAARAKRTGVTADRVLRELARIGFSDIGHYVVDDAGRLELAESAPAGARRAVASVKHRTHTTEGEDATFTTHEVEYRLWDKVAALGRLGQHLKMFTDIVKHEGLDALPDVLRAAEARVLAAQAVNPPPSRLAALNASDRS